MNDDWELHHGDSPLIATALHAGHDLTPAFAAVISLSDAERLREEDPYTDAWTDIAPTRIVVRRSRFELDLNRPRSEAVYQTPEQAWGLKLWRSDLTDALVESSQRRHDEFYAMLERVLRAAEDRFGRFVVYDLHSYNHRRGGPDTPAEDPEANPEINLGTGTLDRDRWGHVADRFMADLRRLEVGGASLDVRENVRFKGGYMSRWIHDRFPTSGCALAIEVKKTFMDEHTGLLDVPRHAAMREALSATVPGILSELAVRDAR
ncbi:MAG: N-formylglutamate amidohydrolase [Nitriliruptorales bacterium]|nr:N-formylglutamate amidohydrolase [Nitriliruptorales bacterium]